MLGLLIALSIRLRYMMLALLYGTQFDWCEDGMAMVPMVGVEAPESLAERRAAVGLPAMVWRRPPPPGSAPPAEAWARRVGWR
jgi:hypothetical protein